jgi:hypothetical protein
MDESRRKKPPGVLKAITDVTSGANNDVSVIADWFKNSYNGYIQGRQAPAQEPPVTDSVNLDTDVLGGIYQPRTKQFYEKPDWGLGLTYRRRY